MNKSFIRLARTELTISIIGLVLFLGYLGFIGYQRNSVPSSPSIAPTTQK